MNVDLLRKELSDFVEGYPEKNRLRAIWRSPLLVSARADDRFQRLKKMAADDHLLPSELLAEAKSVIVFFVPFSKELARENHKADIPAESWGLAYESTNRLIADACAFLQGKLADEGFASETTPPTHNFDHVRLVSRWSHKHLGYIAGLGRFGVNAQFITPSGCAGRMGSLVTDADLGDHPLVTDEELCLHRRGEKCLICVKRCPVGAVSEAEIDRSRCWERLKQNLAEAPTLAGRSDTTHVCGKCQVIVPCSFKVPKSRDDADGCQA